MTTKGELDNRLVETVRASHIFDSIRQQDARRTIERKLQRADAISGLPAPAAATTGNATTGFECAKCGRTFDNASQYRRTARGELICRSIDECRRRGGYAR